MDTNPRRLNIGSGWFPLDGWTNVDEHCPADIQGDFRELEFHGVDEILLSHLLEHLSWRETIPILVQMRGWLRSGGRLTVEVPDMEAIMQMGTDFHDWVRYVYGSQQNEGEYHRAGFTADSLVTLLESAGYEEVTARQFRSEFRTRPGMPCVEAIAYAP